MMSAIFADCTSDISKERQDNKIISGNRCHVKIIV